MYAIRSYYVPKAYELDDYQVRTPTDIIGQHIHLPKWDLTTTDGSGNGWNYEDGTFSREAVVERIDASNDPRITSYNVCYTKLLRMKACEPTTAPATQSLAPLMNLVRE